MVLCNARAITECDRIRSAWLSSAPLELDMEYDISSIEQSTNSHS